MLVFLIGYMGCGKTTIGRKLARELGCQFIDMDHKIEEQEGCTVAQIFATRGQKAFRELERQTLEQLCLLQDAVISTGGGVACHFDNIDLMNSAGETIYIKMSPGALCQRLVASHQKRPLLDGKTPEQLQEFVAANLQEREPFYAKAKYIVEGSNIKTEHLTELFKLEINKL